MKLLYIFVVFYIVNVKAQEINQLKPTLRSLQKILIHIKEFTWELRELKHTLNEIKNKKLQPNTLEKSNKACEQCNECRKLTLKPQDNEQNCLRTPCFNAKSKNKEDEIKKPSTISDNMERKRPDVVPPYSSIAIMSVSGSMFAGIKTLEPRCASLVKKCIMPKQKMGIFSKVPLSEANIIFGCGKVFYLSKQKEMLFNANVFCCSRGMLPALINSTTDLECLVTHYRNIKDGRSDDIFSANYFDVMMKRNFINCKTKESVPEHMWLSSQPDNHGGFQGMVVLRMPYNEGEPAGFDDENYKIKVYPMCEMIT